MQEEKGLVLGLTAAERSRSPRGSEVLCTRAGASLPVSTRENVSATLCFSTSAQRKVVSQTYQRSDVEATL